jgi:hypothetical protein
MVLERPILELLVFPQDKNSDNTVPILGLKCKGLISNFISSNTNSSIMYLKFQMATK